MLTGLQAFPRHPRLTNWRIRLRIGGGPMRNKLISSPVLIAGPAIAADLRQPVPVPVPVPVAGWTGFYIGAHIGAGLGTNDWTNVAVPFSVELGQRVLAPRVASLAAVRLDTTGRSDAP